MTTDFNTSLLGNLFSGTYETIWEVREVDDNGDELEVEYLHSDLMKSIAEEYQGSADYIKEEFGVSWLKGIRFTGGTFSPREYNFSTDSLDMELDIDKEAMIEEVKKLGSQFDEYLKENFSDRDGFWSWTPNNRPELLQELEDEGRRFQQSIGAVLQYLVSREVMEEIEERIFEDWSCNGYRGMNYKIVGE